MTITDADRQAANHQVVDVKAERAAFEAWWRLWCPDQPTPEVTSHICDAWLASARHHRIAAEQAGARKMQEKAAKIVHSSGHEGLAVEITTLDPEEICK